MNNTAKLDKKSITDVEGKFLIPSYQRGYRWRPQEVKLLLEDINAIKEQEEYCLQPIVVQRKGEQYELIDGQQRLTTLYLLFHFFDPEKDPQFTLSYETRKRSKEFLKEIENAQKEEINENIDFYFMYKAYQTIKEWFDDSTHHIEEFKNKLEKVSVIWYEVTSDEQNTGISLFKRLNIGKIPLTNAELIKALFLSDKNMDEKKQQEVSVLWNFMETELGDDSFWYFLTKETKYKTRMDLLFELIMAKETGKAKKKEDKNSFDEYETFFYFSDKQQEKYQIFSDAYQSFLILKDWYEDFDLYHKIGYLIASEESEIQKIFSESREKTKSDFENQLDEEIKDSIKDEQSFTEWEFGEKKDKIQKLLLLFNVETIRQQKIKTQRFPFDEYNNGNKEKWSLEHIHPQNPQSLKSDEQSMWLDQYIQFLESQNLSSDEKEIKNLIEEMKKVKEKKEQFKTVYNKVSVFLSEKGYDDWNNKIGNLALLRGSHNTALSNNFFGVKRDKIIEMDKSDKESETKTYIPFCTKMVFLKCYTPSNEIQMLFWNEKDKEAYIKEIKRVLDKYLESKEK